MHGPAVDGTARPIDHVCDEELAAALRRGLGELFAVERDGLIAETARWLGYLRTGANVRGRLMGVLDRLILQGAVRNTGEQVSLVQTQLHLRQA